jgi:hypothetical protein
MLDAINLSCPMGSKKGIRLILPAIGGLMKNIFTILIAGVFLAFFMYGALADKNAYVNADDGVCNEATKESVLLKGIEESPELLMVVIEGNDLDVVFQRLEKVKMMAGEPPTDKMYVFESENHPHWVYVFFLNKGCIVDVKFTYRNLVEYLITGDESKIRPKENKNG